MECAIVLGFAVGGMKCNILVELNSKCAKCHDTLGTTHAHICTYSEGNSLNAIGSFTKPKLTILGGQSYSLKHS